MNDLNHTSKWKHKQMDESEFLHFLEAMSTHFHSKPGKSKLMCEYRISPVGSPGEGQRKKQYAQ